MPPNIETPRTKPSKIKVLLAATHPIQCTGYARVGCALANGLAEQGYDITYFGYQNLGQNAARTVHPDIEVVDVGVKINQGWGFGESILADELKTRDIDILILYNDVMQLNSFLRALPPEETTCKIVTYVDLVHDNEDIALINEINVRSDMVWVFADHWKSHLENSYGVSPTKIRVVPHGLDPCFVPMSPKKARKLLGLPPDGFIILNTNRNSYRKALDLTIRVFLEFWVKVGKPSNAHLFLNCNMASESGYDMSQLMMNECKRLSLDFVAVSSIHILMMRNSGFITDEVLNALYNACDIGINTCVGEGFGLCGMEHGALGKPQLVNGVGGLNDIFSRGGGIKTKPIASIALCRGFCAHGGTMEIPDVDAMVDVLQRWYDSPEEVVEIGVQGRNAIPARYDWARILDDASRALVDVTKTPKIQNAK
jgi:glycosyltransferase involved in cell wall biosynthesis